MLTQFSYITGIVNLILYLLNQIRKHILDIKCLTELFAGLVIAFIQYALPAFAGQLTVADINRIDAMFAKLFKWRLKMKLFKNDDIIEHSDNIYFVQLLTRITV